MKADTCLIVDPASTGLYLAGALRELGIRSIAGISNLSLGGVKEHDFDQVFRIENDGIGDFSLSRGKILRVIAGSDTGVGPADRLAVYLNAPYQNRSDLAEARRNKWMMGNALRANNVPHAEQELILDFHDLTEWLDSKPVVSAVLKPTKGVASDQVIICNSKAEVIEAGKSIFSNKNYYGEENGQILIQEFLVGNEYMLDTVSLNGKHFLVGAWQAHRQRSGPVLPEHADAADPGSEEVQKIFSYCSNVLDALGVLNGPTHTEIIDVPLRGPLLVEMNARFHGSMDLSFAQRLYGTDHVQETANSIAFPSWAENYKQPSLNLLGRKVYLHSHKAGVAQRTPDYSEYEFLKSYHSIKNRVTVGSCIKKTISLSTSPAVLYLVSDSWKQIQEDTIRARAIEHKTYSEIL